MMFALVALAMPQGAALDVSVCGDYEDRETDAWGRACDASRMPTPESPVKLTEEFGRSDATHAERPTTADDGSGPDWNQEEAQQAQQESQWVDVDKDGRFGYQLKVDMGEVRSEAVSGAQAAPGVASAVVGHIANDESPTARHEAFNANINAREDNGPVPVAVEQDTGVVQDVDAEAREAAVRIESETCPIIHDEEYCLDPPVPEIRVGGSDGASTYTARSGPALQPRTQTERDATLTTEAPAGAAVDPSESSNPGQATDDPRPLARLETAPASADAVSPWDQPKRIAAWSAAAIVPLLLLIKLFSRIARSDLEEHPRRRAILEQVRAQPGLHQEKLRQALGCSSSVIRHHLQKLVDGEILAKRKVGGKVCFFMTGSIDRRSLDAHAVVNSNDKVRCFIDFVRANPDVTARQVADACQIAPSTASYYLRKLRDAGLIQAVPDGTAVRLRVTDAVPTRSMENAYEDAPQQRQGAPVAGA